MGRAVVPERREVVRVGEGEEPRLGPAGAEIRSRGALPVRVRSEEVHRLRPAFPNCLASSTCSKAGKAFVVRETAKAAE